MKVNISKLATGGGMPFVAYTPRAFGNANTVSAQQQASAAGLEAAKKDSGIDIAKILSDSAIKEVIKNGLPNEVDIFFKTLSQMEQGGPFDSGISRGELYLLANMASQIITNKKEFDKAQTDMIKNDSMDEWAGDGSYMFVRDNKTKKIKQIQQSSYDPKRYTPIKNNELLRANAYDKDLAFNSQITSSLKNTIGVKTVVKQILDVVKAMGDSKSTSEDFLSLLEIEGFEASKRPSQQAAEGLLQLNDALEKLGPDALFTLKRSSKSSNVEAALKYIWSVLPDKSKDVLKRRSVIEGDKNMAPENVVLNAISTYRQDEDSYSVDVENSTSAKAAAEKTRALTPHEQLINGDLGVTTMHLRSSKVPNVSMTLHGTLTGHMTTENGAPVMAAPLSEALYASGYISYIDLNNVYFGNAKMNPSKFNNVIYDGQELLHVWMPVDANGNISFEQAARYNQALAKLDNMPNATIEEKNQVLQQAGVSGYYDLSGLFVGTGNMEEFLVTTGETTGNVFDADANLYADELSGNDRKLELDRLKQIYALVNKGRKGDAKYELPTNFFSGTTDIVRAPIFMKMSRTARLDASTNSGVGARVTTPTYQLFAAQDQAQSVVGQNNTLLLYAQ